MVCAKGANEVKRNSLLRYEGIEVIAHEACPPGMALAVAAPSRAEKQLMAGMDLNEQALFMAFCGRVALVKDVAP